MPRLSPKALKCLKLPYTLNKSKPLNLKSHCEPYAALLSEAQSIFFRRNLTNPRAENELHRLGSYRHLGSLQCRSPEYIGA